MIPEEKEKCVNAKNSLRLKRKDWKMIAINLWITFTFPFMAFIEKFANETNFC